MPNWCQNRLAIVGLHEELEAFLKRAGLRDETPVFSLGRLYPEPDYEKHPEIARKQIDENQSEQAVMQRALRQSLGQNYEKELGWYDWRIANWGTKWEPSDVHIREERRSEILLKVRSEICDIRYIEIEFNTAWAAPEAALKTIFADERRLGMFLFYYEPGCDFEGELAIVNGEVTYEQTRPARPDFDWMVEDCLEVLRDYLIDMNRQEE